MIDFRDEAEVLTILGKQFDFPTNYLVLDTETTGFSPTKDFIIDAGWCVVKNNEIVHQQNLLIDWSKLPTVDHEFIQQQLLRQATHYARDGRPHYYPWERLKEEGEHPLQVLHAYAQLIYEHIQHPDSLIIGHGFWRFDRKMIDSHTQRFLENYTLPWRLNSIFDTGLLEKAAQMNKPPWENESLDEWLRRVSNANSKGVKYNMERHCVPKYRLAERYDIDMRLMHTAGFDCVLIYHLMNTFHELVEIINGQRKELTDTHQNQTGITQGSGQILQRPQG